MQNKAELIHSLSIYFQVPTLSGTTDTTISTLDGVPYPGERRKHTDTQTSSSPSFFSEAPESLGEENFCKNAELRRELWEESFREVLAPCGQMKQEPRRTLSLRSGRGSRAWADWGRGGQSVRPISRRLARRRGNGEPTGLQGEIVGRDEAGISAGEYSQIAEREGSGGVHLLGAALLVGGPAVLYC